MADEIIITTNDSKQEQINSTETVPTITNKIIIKDKNIPIFVKIPPKARPNKKLVKEVGVIKTASKVPFCRSNVNRKALCTIDQ